MAPKASIDRPKIFTVVLTGGIASGKTAASDHFADLGVPVIDTDVIARKIVEPGQPALRRIKREFGSEFIDAEGRLDRRKMREAIFADSNLKTRLESILHPLIVAEALRRINRADAPYCIVVVPLYAEGGRWPWVDRVLVIDTDPETQVDRLMRRDAITRKLALSILASQAKREIRLKLADDVIENLGEMNSLKRRVLQLHEKYCRLARGSPKCGLNDDESN